MPHRQFPSSELCITHKFSNRSPSNPNGIPPQSPGLGGTTYPGNNVHEAFSTPKVLRQSSAIWAQPRWGCFEQGPKSQGRPAAVAAGQPWAGGRNPVGIKGNEAALRIANLWVALSSQEGVGVECLGQSFLGFRSRGASRGQWQSHDPMHLPLARRIVTRILSAPTQQDP